MQEGDVHGHRIRVVQQPGVRAHLCHVPRDVGQDRKGPQAAEDSADADGVADGLLQSVLRRDLEVAHRGVVHTDLDDVDDVVGAVECAATVGAGGHLGVSAGRAGGGSRDRLRGLETFGVDVVQHDPRRAEFGKRQDVSEKLAGELDAAGPDDDDGGFHASFLAAEDFSTAAVGASPRFSSL